MVAATYVAQVRPKRCILPAGRATSEARVGPLKCCTRALRVYTAKAVTRI